MQYKVTHKSRIWAVINGATRPDQPVRFIEKGTSVDGYKEQRQISSDNGNFQEWFINMNDGRFILAKNVKQTGKGYSSADGGKFTISPNTALMAFSGGVVGGISGVFVSKFIERKHELSASKSLGIVVVATVLGVIGGYNLGIMNIKSLTKENTENK